MPYRPRWLNRLYAGLFGYFWLPCPLCGEYFGGHEWRGDNQDVGCYRNPYRIHAICTRCEKAELGGGTASQAYCVRRECKPHEPFVPEGETGQFIERGERG